ncbi:ATP-binding protein [Streptomyces sp. NPDC005728]|uniref:sensor histidine kinase n=1 Tax=Streptomyces sp. NPDC005728 TaxID=3157054 RepID=UPI0033F0FB75
MAVSYSLIEQLVIVPMWIQADPRFGTESIVTNDRRVIVAVAVLASLSMVFRRRFPVAVAALAELAGWCHGNALLFSVAIYTLVVQGRYRWVAFFSVTISVVPFINPIRAPFYAFYPDMPFLAQLLYALTIYGIFGVGLAVFIGTTVRTHRMIIGSHTERAEQLRREWMQRARSIRFEERARLARDLHAIVTEHVEQIVGHAGTLKARSGGRLEVAQTAGLMEDLGRKSMTELNDLLNVLRSGADGVESGWGLDEQADRALQAKVEELVSQTRSIGTAIHWQLKGELGPVHRPAYELAYRCIQEGLTNARRHAPGAQVDITVNARPKELCITVHNGATTMPPRTHEGGGYGLAGLKRRAAELQATLIARPTRRGGFELVLRAPTNTAPQDDARRSHRRLPKKLRGTIRTVNTSDRRPVAD